MTSAIEDDSVWTTVFGVPLTRIEASTNNVFKQWCGKGGDKARDLAQLFGVTQQQFYKLAAKGIIPSFRVGAAGERACCSVSDVEYLVHRAALPGSRGLGLGSCWHLTAHAGPEMTRFMTPSL